jgi:uncharacterized phage protein (TIGR02218 family)
MRAWPALLLAHLQGPAPCPAQALYILRDDGQALALTTADIEGTVADVPIGGSVEPSVTFTPSPEGVSFSAIVRSVGTDVDNAEAEILEGGALTLADVLDERWRGAWWVMGVYSWAHPEYGFGPVSCGVVGKIKPRVGKFPVELRDIRQLLQSNPTPVTQKGCLWQLGSNDEVNGFCTLDLTPHTFPGEVVTAVASQREFTVAGLGQADDYFGNGIVTWTAGVNTGREVRILSQTGDVIVLDTDMVQGIEVGDELTLVAGCRGRFEEDCVTKFGNPLNNGGQPHAPGPDPALNGTVA